MQARLARRDANVRQGQEGSDAAGCTEHEHLSSRPLRHAFFEKRDGEFPFCPVTNASLCWNGLHWLSDQATPGCRVPVATLRVGDGGDNRREPQFVQADRRQRPRRQNQGWVWVRGGNVRRQSIFWDGYLDHQRVRFGGSVPGLLGHATLRNRWERRHQALEQVHGATLDEAEEIGEQEKNAISYSMRLVYRYTRLAQIVHCWEPLRILRSKLITVFSMTVRLIRKVLRSWDDKDNLFFMLSSLDAII